MSSEDSTPDEPKVLYWTHFKFNVLYVLESLRDGEPKTGEDVYDQVIYPMAVDAGIHTEYKRVRNENELRRELERIRLAAENANHKPIVHIEAHGTDHGIELTDGSVVTWKALAPQFAAINEASEFNLVVVAVSCNGWNLTLSLMPSDRAPVAFLVGPVEGISGTDLEGAMRRFYATLIEKIDFSDALLAANLGLPREMWKVSSASAEILFCRVFRQYMAIFSVESNRLGRENQIVADLTRHDSLDLLQSASVRMNVRRDLVDFRSQYYQLRESFLMLDKFPVNRERLGMTYELCLPVPEHRREGDV